MNNAYDLCICVSLYNNTSFLDKQIINIKNCLSGNMRTKLIYFDDGSSPEKLREAQEICSKHLIELRPLLHHKGFGSVCKDMADYAISCADYVLFLDSDVFLPTSFIRNLIQTMSLMTGEIGVLSFISYNSLPLNILEHNITLCLSAIEDRACNNDFRLPERATQLATYCYAFSSSSYEELRKHKFQGFCPEYLAYYSDSDLCCQFAALGYKSYRMHFPAVYHVEHATLNSNNLDCDMLRKKDYEVFLKRWEKSPEKMEKQFLLSGE